MPSRPAVGSVLFQDFFRGHISVSIPETLINGQVRGAAPAKHPRDQIRGRTLPLRSAALSKHTSCAIIAAHSSIRGGMREALHCDKRNHHKINQIQEAYR